MLYTLQYGLHDFHGFRANTDFLSGREFWIQSKKIGEGGRLEDYLGTENLSNLCYYLFNFLTIFIMISTEMI